MGLKIDLKPSEQMLTTPKEFDLMFPGSQGSLYGRTPHGITSTFMRPMNRNKIQGLLLVGGGTHPGAGVPMACLSGRHAGRPAGRHERDRKTSVCDARGCWHDARADRRAAKNCK